MIELQEPSDLMVVAERFTPSGRRIPDAKMRGEFSAERVSRFRRKVPQLS